MDIDRILETLHEWKPLDERLAWEPKSDLGNANRLSARFGADLLHVDNIGWYVWDGRRWNREDGDAGALVYAHETALAIRFEARALEALLARRMVEDAGGDAERMEIITRLDQLIADPVQLRDKRKPPTMLARWGIDSGNASRSAGMLGQLAPYCRAQPDEMDADPFLWNAANVALELEPPGAEAPGGDPVRPRPFDRADRCSQLGGVDFDPDAQAPEFRKFLAEILPDPDLRNFVQRWFGYCLTGSQDEQAFLVMHGEGSNGKSTLLEALRPVFGDYTAAVDMNSFLHTDKQRGSDASPDFARLPGKRTAMAAETNPGDRLAEKIVKTITGGEPMTARHLHRPFFEFRPVFKLILSCNQKPVIRGQDRGIWRRVLLLPFTRTFDKGEIDMGLGARLQAEGPGILNWCLDGFRMWRERGLMVPDAVIAATEGYRTDSDPVGEFLSSALEPAPGHNIQAAHLFSFYVRWAKANGVAPLSATGFGRRAKQRLQHEKIGVQFYTDVGIAAPARKGVEAYELSIASGAGGPGARDDRGPPVPEGDL